MTAKNIIIFGVGPMPCDPDNAVMAPGARTWQIVQTVARAVNRAGSGEAIHVLTLEPANREHAGFIDVPVGPAGEVQRVSYSILSIEQFKAISTDAKPLEKIVSGEISAVIGCASVQPCSTAAEVALREDVPFWADVFGDPFSEIQSKAELEPEHQDANDVLAQFVWKLYLPVLLAADRFSVLSGRQRFALMGQLGVTGRLNRHTATEELIYSIPFGLFSPDFREVEHRPSPDTFTVMWCGSFNTWMDVSTLADGLRLAAEKEPRLRLLVVGGKIHGYNEKPYNQFVEAISTGGISDRVELLEWQSLAKTQELYARCNCGLSIDRYTYEAVLGSRTRIIQFLAAGVPVISTDVTELTNELVGEGFVLPFELNNAQDLARALTDAAEIPDAMRRLGRQGRAYVREHFEGETLGKPLADWVVAPKRTGDRQPLGKMPDNKLYAHWRKIHAKQ